MRQCLHIFAKDVRFLWMSILAALVLNAIFAWSRSVDPRIFARGSGADDVVPAVFAFFLILSWWHLVYRAVQQEPPAGDRQFWVTRPYAWKSLAGAKALFLLVFIHIPFLISDVTILAAHGLAPSAASLLIRQAALAGIVLLPVAALAAVAGHEATVAVTIVVLVVILTFVTDGGPLSRSWGRFGWMPLSLAAAILSLAGAGVFVWQYARRRTALARAVLAVAAVLCYAALTIKPTGVTLAYGTAPDDLRSVRLTPRGEVSPGLLALQIDGLPPGMQAEPELVELTVEPPGGAPRRSGWQPPANLLRSAGDNRFNVELGPQLRPLQVKVSLALSVFGAPQTVPVSSRPTSIEGIGACRIVRSAGMYYPSLSCEGAEPRRSRALVNGRIVLADRPGHRASFEASPVFTSSTLLTDTYGSDPVVLSVERPVALILRSIEVTLP